MERRTGGILNNELFVAAFRQMQAVERERDAAMRDVVRLKTELKKEKRKAERATAEADALRSVVDRQEARLACLQRRARQRCETPDTEPPSPRKRPRRETVVEEFAG